MEEDNYIRAGGNGFFPMGQAQYITKDRGRLRQIVDALCPIGDEEDKYASKSMMNDVLGKAYKLTF